MATLFVYHDLPSCSILRVWVYVSLASASFPRLSKRYVRCVTTMFFMCLDIQFSLVGNFSISIFIGWNFSISRSSRDTLSHWMAKWWGSTEVKSLICIPFSKMKYSVGWTVCLCPLIVSVCVMCRPSFFHHRPAGKAGRDGKRLVCSWQGPTEQHHHSGMFVSFLVWQSGNETEWQLTSYMYVGWGCFSSCPLLSLLHHLPPSLDRRGASQPTGPGETV